MASRIYLRVVFLLVGAALALAFALLDGTLIALMVQSTALPLWAVIGVGAVLVVAPVVLLGLLPALRTVEGVAAQSLLGVELPGGPPGPARTWPQRRRALGWFLLHLLAGSVLVAAVMATIGWSTGWLALPMVLGATLLAVALGELLAWLAPRVLGPSYADRLELLERSVTRAVERNRIAREIHDSVGHALSLVTVQAAAARKVIDRDPAFAVGALAAIETAARSATADLDHVLGVLREDVPADAGPRPDLRALGELVGATREAGLDLSHTVDGELDSLPPALSREAYRLVQEGFTNALRHSGDGTAQLRVTRSSDRLLITVRNPGGPVREGRAGRGLRGIEERVAALGGEVDAGVDGGDWRLDVSLPLPGGGRR